MGTPLRRDEGSPLPLAWQRRIDEACTRYEEAWRAGRRPRIEDYLGEAAEPGRSALLAGLLKTDLELRRAGGEDPGLQEYRVRFPEHVAVIRTAFEEAPAPPPAARPRGTEPRADADRNLLFGVLALQLDFITRDALIAALHAWVLQKQRPLGSILVEQGVLAANRHALLEALVREHLEQHGDDAERSLAALSALESTRQRLERIANPELQASLSRIPTLRRLEAGSEAAPAPGRPIAGSSGPRFRILRPHARGGLGEVYIAVDAELNREVALKEIRPAHAHDPHNRARFLMEAEITGRLEHPGIVPVYGLGYYADGRPYYAMRFIKGDSLKEAIARFHRSDGAAGSPSERARILRQLLGRFVDVCNAVAYAHSRGVLHRDLKPGNIMLGPYGETLVVDWGLAKPAGRPEGALRAAEGTLRPESANAREATLPGTPIGTPAYTSPEQTAGRLDQLGPASDVYSLGATLYCLFTGQAPFRDSDPDVVQQQVRRGEFPPPRQVNRAVAPALEAVCLKAMAREPESRYASPRALAEDIEHWLGDEPVSAYPERWGQRLTRWMRRHRTWTQAGVAALLLVATVAIAAALAVERARRQELWALDQATRALADRSAALAAEQVAVAEAHRQRDRAERHLVQAEENLRSACDAVDRYYTKVSEDRLLNVPHMEKLRQELLALAQQFYQQFVDERKEDTRLQADLGRAYRRLAKITYDIASKPQAVDYGRHAVTIFTKLTEDHPDVTAYQSELVDSYNSLGIFSEGTGRLGEAEAAYRQALAIQEPLARDHPDVTAYQGQLAASYHALARVLLATRRWAEAEVVYRQVLAIQEPLARDHPDVAAYRSELAASYHNLGVLYRATRRLIQAEASNQQAAAIRARLVRDHPEVIAYQSQLAASYRNLGNLYLNTGRLTPAEAAYQREAAIRAQLARDHPDVVAYQSALASSHSCLGDLYGASDRWGLAEGSYRRALALQEGLAQVNTDRAAYQRGREQLQLKLTLALARVGKPEQAAAAVDSLVAAESVEPVTLYTAACVYSLVAAAPEPGARSNPVVRGPWAERHAARAVALLARADGAGYFEDPARIEDLKKDPDLEALRGRTDFQTLISDLTFPSDPFAR